MPTSPQITRHQPPKGAPESPYRTGLKQYQMADPRIGANCHLAEHAIFKDTLEEVVDGLRRGLALWMKQPDKRRTLIRAASLKVTSL
jgi:hypothetical protein